MLILDPRKDPSGLGIPGSGVGGFVGLRICVMYWGANILGPLGSCVLRQILRSSLRAGRVGSEDQVWRVWDRISVRPVEIDTDTVS